MKLLFICLSFYLCVRLCIADKVDVVAGAKEFHEKFKLKKDPFGILESKDLSVEDMKKVDIGFVAPGMSTDASVSWVFGQKGTGKTFLTKLHTAKLPQDTLLVPINAANAMVPIWKAYEQNKGCFGEYWNGLDFMDLIVYRALQSLLSTNNLVQKLENNDKRSLYLLSHLYCVPDSKISLHILQQDLGIKGGSSWAHTGVGHNERKEIRVVLHGEENIRLFQEAVQFLKLSDVELERTIYLHGTHRLQFITTISQKLGFSNVYVIVDELDESTPFQGSEGARNLKMFYESTMRQDIYVYVNLMACFPVQLSEVSAKARGDARCDKKPCIDLKWKYHSLIDMAEKLWRNSQGIHKGSRRQPKLRFPKIDVCMGRVFRATINK